MSTGIGAPPTFNDRSLVPLGRGREGRAATRDRAPGLPGPRGLPDLNSKHQLHRHPHRSIKRRRHWRPGAERCHRSHPSSRALSRRRMNVLIIGRGRVGNGLRRSLEASGMLEVVATGRNCRPSSVAAADAIVLAVSHNEFKETLRTTVTYLEDHGALGGGSGAHVLTDACCCGEHSNGPWRQGKSATSLMIFQGWPSSRRAPLRVRTPTTSTPLSWLGSLDNGRTPRGAGQRGHHVQRHRLELR